MEDGHKENIGHHSEEAEEEVMCSICLGVMTSPLVTICNHKFCEECLFGWFDAKALFNGELGTCPMCRHRIGRPPRQAQVIQGQGFLPDNDIDIAEMIEELSR